MTVSPDVYYSLLLFVSLFVSCMYGGLLLRSDTASACDNSQENANRMPA